MATNKNALIRYKVLDKCFRNPGRQYFIEDLIDECAKVLMEIDPASNGISKRQIFDDINLMESNEGWQADIERHRDGKKVYYRYADLSFSINNMPLNETEIKHLKEAVDILSQFKGMPQFEWINELVPKLKQGFASEDASAAIIEFDSNQYLKGIEHLGTLYNAIFYKKVLLINYQPYENEKPYKVTIHPYFLKQYNNRWFLFGYNPLYEKYDWNLALDRISDISETKGRYEENAIIDWREYFEDIIGVSKQSEEETENIILHFTGKTGKYIETKPIHGSQKSKWLNKELLEVKLQLIINYEIEQLVLSYADSVKVISPEHFKNKITQRLHDAFSQYSG